MIIMPQEEHKTGTQEKVGKNTSKRKMKQQRNIAMNSSDLFPKAFNIAMARQHYAFAGRHSAVKICEWTKKSLLDEDFCYKQKFYGIRSHLCCQMTPTLGFCSNKCIFCWRPHEYNQGYEMNFKVDDPDTIIDKSIEAQRKLLSGFGGNPNVDEKKFKEAQEPMHFAISLTGEPTIYPKLPELIRRLHERGKTTFLVTNGMYPDMLNRLEKEDSLPTQIYVSLSAPDAKRFMDIDKPVFDDGWERLMKSFDFLARVKDKTRTVIRVTLIKDINMIHPEKYAEVLRRANPTFIEVKAYMYVGYSRKRLKMSNMPSHQEVKEFAAEIAKNMNYKIIDDKPVSRVVLLMKDDFPGRIMKFD